MKTDIKDLLIQLKADIKAVEPLLKADMCALKKDDEEKDPNKAPEGEVPPAAPAGEMAPAAEGGEQPPASPDSIEDAAEQPPEQAEESLEQIFASLQPEDLQNVIAAAQAALAGKQGQQQPPADGSMPPPPAAPAASPDLTQKSEMEKMAKAMDEVKKQNESLMKSVIELKAKVDAKPIQVSRPVAMSSKVETLEKSETPPEMLSKSEVCAFLLGEQKKAGSKLGKEAAGLMSDANRADSPERMRKVYSAADSLGVKIPMRGTK